MPPRRGRKSRFHFSPLDWIGNLTPEEANGMITIIDKRTPKGKQLSIELQRRWVAYRLVLREVVAKRGLSYGGNLPRLMTICNLTESSINRRLSAIYELYKKRQSKLPAA